MSKRYLWGGTVAAVGLGLSGCGHNNPPVAMAPPTTPVTISQPAGGPGNYSPDQVFQWNQVPLNQQVPIMRAVFDQGGYQLYDNSGDTIVVPFANQNMYVMKFGRSDSGGMYFINDGQVPTLFVPNGAYLENASAQGARWYPFPQNYAYTQPVYVGLAPSWSAFTGMGWYPGMSYYGGYWGYHPFGVGAYTPMVGLHFLIGGQPYYGFNSYHNYYISHPTNAVRTRTVYNNYSSFRSSAPLGTRRTFGSGGYNTAGTRTSGSGSSFGRSRGSFGSGSSSYSGGARQTGGSFGQSPSGYGGSFGTGRRTFGTGGSSFGSSPSGPPSGGSSFGRPSSGGSSFGSSSSGSSSFGRPSSGGSSFGGSSYSRPSGGSSFGGGRSSGGGSFGGGGRSFGGFRRR